MADDPKKPVPAASPTLPADRPPTPTATLLAQLQDLHPEAVEQAIVDVREAWKRGDQSFVADALIAQASVLEALASKFLHLASGKQMAKVVEIYAGLALRSFEAARKALATLAGLREKPRVTTAVQVNVGQPGTAPGAPTEILSGERDDDQA